jgi:hypothetical protein
MKMLPAFVVMSLSSVSDTLSASGDGFVQCTIAQTTALRQVTPDVRAPLVRGRYRFWDNIAERTRTPASPCSRQGLTDSPHATARASCEVN